VAEMTSKEKVFSFLYSHFDVMFSVKVSSNSR